MRTSKALRVLIFTVSILVFSVTAWSAPKAYFSPEDDLTFQIQNEFARAQKSIDLAIYTFSSPSVLQELEKAAGRNVKLRLLVRKSIETGQPGFLQKLRDQGAEVRWINKINHHKFAIVDGETLLSSSGNISETELQKSYDENLLICADCAAARAAFQEEFDFLFKNSNLFVPAQTLELRWLSVRPAEGQDPAAYFTSRNYQPAVDNRRNQVKLENIDDSKLGNVETRLISVIAGAKASIKIATGHFRSSSLLDALAQAVKRGVKVELVLDSQEYVSKYKLAVEDKQLKACVESGKNTRAECRRRGFHYSRHAHKAGVDVRIKSYSLRWDFMKSPQMHHKYMIIDGQVLYSGSYNWSYNAEFESTENIWVLKDKSTVAEYLKNFERIRDYGRGEYKTLLQSFRNEAEALPYHYVPISMTYPQMDELRQIACEKCPDVFCNSAVDEERVAPPKRGTELPAVPAASCKVEAN
jgi:phosphatidylserine/phosphatidylglycerophosphate/cardiolipin synthase-like enzyme